MASIPIIGLGAVGAPGYGVENCYQAVSEGRDSLRPLSLFNSELKEIPLCGQVELNPGDMLQKKVTNRCIGFALWAVQEALSNIKERKGLRLGIVLATTIAGMTDSEKFYRNLKKKPDFIRNAASMLAFHEPTSITGTIASYVNAQGFHTISTACSTGLHALGIAKRLIEQDAYDLCLAVGVDALALLIVRGFASLMLIDFSGCKPFDKRRIGISLGEGAGAILLASKKAAENLSAEPLGVISGWGASADCHHMTAPHPDGEGAAGAAALSLSEAKINPSDISMIAAHGTATPDNDISEIKAMRKIFDQLPPFCSMKRTLGHTMAASGTLEAVFCVCALNHNTIPATAGFEQPDEAIGVEPSPRIKRPICHILKNSFGFGGNNATVVISKYSD